MSDALIINPHARLRPEQDGPTIHAITLRAPVRGDRLRVNTVRRDSDPALFGILLIYLLTQRADVGGDRLNDAQRAQLADWGFLIREDQASNPVFFECDPSEPPQDLLPNEITRPSVRASNVQSLGTEGPTSEMRGRLDLPNPFRRDRTWFRVEDAGLASPALYSCAPANAAQLERLLTAQTGPDASKSRRAAAAHQELIARRYTVLRDLLPPLQLAAIRRYYRELIGQGFVQLGDDEWPDRYFAKRDALAYCFHQGLTDLISEVAGERVKPSFAFLTSYLAGAKLPAHKDREQCYFSVSILLDHQPAPLDDISPWPIYVQPPQDAEATPIRIALGDGLMYFGQEVRHYRDALPAGQSTLWFFFYVPESFEGPLD